LEYNVKFKEYSAHHPATASTSTPKPIKTLFAGMKMSVARKKMVPVGFASQLIYGRLRISSV
jgi:hypothetical protein